MLRVEEANRTIEIVITHVGKNTQTFLIVEIKIKAKDKISIDLYVIHKATKDICKGSSLNTIWE